MLYTPLRVGIIGTGWIAEKAAITLNGLKECEAYAVGSRSIDTAETFATKWHIARAYGSYSELIADPNVDLIYIGTPHSHHYDVTKEALRTGKPCLVEKAFMANARQTGPSSTVSLSHVRCPMPKRSTSCNSWMACAASGTSAIPWIRNLHKPKMMKKLLIFSLFTALGLLTATAQRGLHVRKNVLLDSIRLSDPAILADQKTGMYYMTGTGGMMWRSADLKLWEGPMRVTEFEADSWMGLRPMIWAAELHQTGDGWYYYFATFTNQAVKIDTVRGNVIERRASQVLRADNPMGPYRAFGDATYLPADRPTLDGTYWKDKDGKPYMVFCGEWLQNWNGTMEKIELKSDLSGTVGEAKVLFRASDSPWSREKNDKGEITWNKVTDGPYLFRTGTGRLGMVWTSWVFDVYTQGVAYSESGTLDGPWTQEPEPITPPGYGHSMLFQRFDGQWMMSVHHHSKDARGRTVRIPHLFEVDLSGDKLIVKSK